MSISTEQITALAALISALTALVALLVSPLVSIYALKKQINATVLSPSRREWIVTLRGHLAELLGILFIVGMKIKAHEDREFILQKFERFVCLESQIRLMINPLEQDHVRLVELIREAAQEFVRDDPDSLNRLNRLIPQIVEQAQPVLKREWVRVKGGG